MEARARGAATSREDEHGRWLVVLMIAVLAALATSWAVFLLLR